MKILGHALITFLCTVCFGYTDEVRLYEDEQINVVYEKHVERRDDGFLKVVPNGETKPISEIFGILGVDPKRLGTPLVEGMNMVDFHIWQLSNGYQLSIMVAINDPDNGGKALLELKGYGVRLKQMKKRQQGGTGQPATRSQSKSEGSDKPQPEAEGRSR
jgi:hypothetical protein